MEEVMVAVSSWNEVAIKYGISRRERELKSIAFKTIKK